MSQSAIGSARIVPQTGAQVLETEIIATFPQASTLAAGAGSTQFNFFQCNFRGSLRGVLLTFTNSDNTIFVVTVELRRNVSPLPASPAESAISAQGGTDQILPNNLGLNPINNSQALFDLTNAYQQGDLPIYPGDVLF